MVVQCPSCLTKFSVDPAVFAKFSNPRFHCTRCGHYFSSPTASGKLDSPAGATAGAPKRRSVTDEAEQLELLPKVGQRSSSPKKHRRVERSGEHNPPPRSDEDISVTAQWNDDQGLVQYEADLGTAHTVEAEVMPPPTGRMFGSGFAGRIPAGVVAPKAIEHRQGQRPVEPSSESLRDSGIELFDPNEAPLHAGPVAEWNSPEFDTEKTEYIAPGAGQGYVGAADQGFIGGNQTVGASSSANPAFGAPDAPGAIESKADFVFGNKDFVTSTQGFDNFTGNSDSVDSHSSLANGADSQRAEAAEDTTSIADSAPAPFDAGSAAPPELQADGFEDPPGADFIGSADTSSAQAGWNDSWSYGSSEQENTIKAEPATSAPPGSRKFAAPKLPRIRIPSPQLGPVSASVIRSAASLSVPLLALVLFLRLSGFFGGYHGVGAASEAPLRFFTSIGEDSLPRAAPVGMELTDIRPEILSLDNGEAVVQLSGNVVNTTRRKISEAVIEAKTFSTSVEQLERIEVNFSNGLTNAARLGALATASLLELQAHPGIKEARLNPNERAPFKLIIPADAGKAAWFSARIARVKYEDS